MAESTIDDVVRETFKHLWREGYDGKDLAEAFVRVAAAIVRNEQPSDILCLRRLLEDDNGE